MAGPRTFIVRVSEAPRRVIVEDVRHRRRAVAGSLDGVGTQITAWLEAEPDGPPPEARLPQREDSVSPTS